MRKLRQTNRWLNPTGREYTRRQVDRKDPARWSVPRHLLGDAPLVNGEIRKLASSQNKDRYTAKEDLTRILMTNPPRQHE